MLKIKLGDRRDPAVPCILAHSNFSHSILSETADLTPSAKSVFTIPKSTMSFYCSADDASEALDSDCEV